MLRNTQVSQGHGPMLSRTKTETSQEKVPQERPTSVRMRKTVRVSPGCLRETSSPNLQKQVR